MKKEKKKKSRKKEESTLQKLNISRRTLQGSILIQLLFNIFSNKEDGGEQGYQITASKIC